MFELKLENIGKIKSATVKIGGLTVIAGENDTGKSTIGKLLFSLIKGINNPINITQDKLNEIKSSFMNVLNNNILSLELRPQISQLVTSINKENIFLLREDIIKYCIECEKCFNAFLSNIEGASAVQIVDGKQKNVKIKDIFKDKLIETRKFIENYDNVTGNTMYKNTFQNIMYSEFKHSTNIRNNTDSGKIIFGNLELDLGKENVLDTSNFGAGLCVYSDITLIETPLILTFSNLINRAQTLDNYDIGQDIRSPSFTYVQKHQKDLVNKLMISSKNGAENLEKSTIMKELLANIINIIGGCWIYDEKKVDFTFIKNGEVTFQSWNTASGIKSFGLIQLLLKSNILNEKSILVIDEPENHLHPEWHLKYAEIIIALVKAGIPVVLTTHSSSFIGALNSLANEKDLKIDYAFAEIEEDGTIIKTDDENSYKNIMNALSTPLLKILNKKLNG